MRCELCALCGFVLNPRPFELRHRFELEGTLTIQVLEEVAFVGLVPAEFPGGNWAEIEAVDVGAVHHGMLKCAIRSDDGSDKGGADFLGCEE